MVIDTLNQYPKYLNHILGVTCLFFSGVAGGVNQAAWGQSAPPLGCGHLSCTFPQRSRLATRLKFTLAQSTNRLNKFKSLALDSGDYLLVQYQAVCGESSSIIREP